MRGGGLRESRGLYTGHGIEVARTVGQSRTALGIEAPLRAETGMARLQVPVGGTLHTGVRYADRTAALPPEARELRIGATATRSVWALKPDVRASRRCILAPAGPASLKRRRRKAQAQQQSRRFRIPRVSRPGQVNS